MGQPRWLIGAVAILILLAIVAAAIVLSPSPSNSSQTETFQTISTISQPPAVTVTQTSVIVVTTSTSTATPAQNLGGANVQLTNQTKAKTNYNPVNVIKDSAIVLAAGVGSVACASLTLGACILAFGGLAALIGLQNDEILSVSTTLTFVNFGDQTATGWTYAVLTYINGNLTSSSPPQLLQPLGSQQSVAVTYSKDYTWADLPALVVDAVAHEKANVTFVVQSPQPPA